MNNAEWKEYRRQTNSNDIDPPVVNTGDVLALLDECDDLRKALKQSVSAMTLALTRIPYGDKEPQVIRKLKAAIQQASVITERGL